MFQKYISKISNTIGTVNYLQQKTRKSSQPQLRSRQSSKHTLLYDDGYDVVEVDVSANASRKSSLNEELFPSTQTILSEAVAKLRNTLLFYPLVSNVLNFWKRSMHDIIDLNLLLIIGDVNNEWQTRAHTHTHY